MYTHSENAYLSVYTSIIIYHIHIPCPYVLSARDYPYRCFRMMKIDKQIILVGELESIWACMYIGIHMDVV